VCWSANYNTVELDRKMIKIIINFAKRLVDFIVIVLFLLSMIPVALIALVFLDSNKEYPRINSFFVTLEDFVYSVYKWARII